MINKLLGKAMMADLWEHWKGSRGGSERGFCVVGRHRIMC